MKKMMLVDFSELLEHSQDLGFTWNEAHELLVKADIYVGSINKDWYTDAFSKSDEHVDAKNILKSFMKKYNLTEFYITPKNHDY